MFNSNRYIVDWKKLVTWLLPYELVKPKVLAWMKAIIYPHQLLYADFLRFKKDTNYWLSINSQVCRMRTMLNDVFDPTQRRIYIDDGKLGTAIWLFLDSENNPVWLNKDSEVLPQYLFLDLEFVSTQAHFIVYVPMAIKSGLNVPELTSLVNSYKLPSRRWALQYF